ncbi:putative LppA-like lipoprotein [Knoellia remsis]|uniref:Putative LppA-like lipoprotein n=1 Tax=Knoellia remsis TaxID=407159 RepID=A0A2T0U142_9MICO|nr:LppA family lipoprotein [Knoellia remsis]PRY51624.1 putative LppA-like lipoprotein [Knoellia remsis]
MDARAELEKRRSYAEARADNLALLAEVRSAMSGAAPNLKWVKPEPEVDGESSCVEPQFANVAGASHATFDSGGAEGGISDADWPKAWAAVQQVAGQRGFGDPKVVIDKPGQHVVSLYDKDGAELSINSEVNTAVSIYGACHLKDPSVDSSSASP